MDGFGSGKKPQKNFGQQLLNSKANTSIKNKKTQAKTLGGQTGKLSLIQAQEGKG